MSKLAAEGWMLEAVSQSDGVAPTVRVFAVGHEAEAACIQAVKSLPDMAADAVVAPKRRLTFGEIDALKLKEGGIQQQ